MSAQDFQKEFSFSNTLIFRTLQLIDLGKIYCYNLLEIEKNNGIKEIYMCGIIGYSGRSKGIGKVLEGLSVLEYRGYDSAGLAAMCNGKIKTVKTEGRVVELSKKLANTDFGDLTAAIGHTRWATHGAPSDVNAHPHRVGSVTLVHNGIIENYGELRKALGNGADILKSDTDTEVAAAVIYEEFKRLGSPYEAIKAATARFLGSYAFAVLFDGCDGEIYAVRHGSPLILGKGEDGGYLASDITALLPFTRTYFTLPEDKIAVIRESCASIITATGEEEISDWKRTDLTPERAKLSGYPHFMKKEMHEEPDAISAALGSRVRDGIPCFEGDGISAELLRSIDSIEIVACGSAMHAGLVGATLIERFAKIPASVYIASEYRYFPPVSKGNSLVIVISQSGETADTIAALRYAKANGKRTLGIVNATATTIANEADFCLYTHAGPEIAVATTKGYTTQIAVLYLLAVFLGYCSGALTHDKTLCLTKELLTDAPLAAKEMLGKNEEIKEIAKKIYGRNNAFFIGRGIDYLICMEGSLKLKEISYIHSEAYAAGELKHGTISLIEDGVPTVALATDESVFDKLVSNLREVTARGGFTVLITSKRNSTKLADVVFELPDSSLAAKIFSLALTVQLLAYEVAFLRGADIDRPKNLAKSVTVE